MEHEDTPVNGEMQKAVDAMLPSRRPDGRMLPGFTANPNGRPRKTYSDIAAALPDDLKEKHIMAQSDKALAGDTRAFEALRDSAEGKPSVRVEIQDTSYDDQVFSKVLQALAAAGQLRIRDVVDGEYREVPAEELAPYGLSGEWLDTAIHNPKDS